MSLTSAANSQSAGQAPPPPPPKTCEDLPQISRQVASPPVPPYHSHPTQSPYTVQQTQQTPPPPPRPPSHPALTYAEQRTQSSPQVLDTFTSRAELDGSDNGSAAFTAGRQQSVMDNAATAQLPQAPGHPQQLDHEHSAQAQSHDGNAPAMPPDGWLPEILRGKSKPDLETALQTPTLLSGLLYHSSTQPPILAHSKSELRQQLDATIKLAQRVSDQAQQVEVERARTQALLLRTRGAEQTFRTRQHAHEDAIEAFGPRALHRRLAQATREGEDELRVMQESFLNADGIASERDVQEWVKGVRKAREVVELRKERGERWAEGRVGGWR